MKIRHAALLLCALPAVAGAQPVMIGERPAVEIHLDQAAIESGSIRMRDLFAHGRLLFEARFNALDGVGRPGSTGSGAPRDPTQPLFTRISGPDASSCVGCHHQGGSGGGAEFGIGNVFVLAQNLDPVIFTIDPMFSNDRNSVGMFGAGPIEMLAREMSAELIAIREEATTTAAATGMSQTRDLFAKGVHFGKITVLPNGMINPSEIEGVDWDLIVKPFHQKGAVVSLREFSNNAMNHHHGMQSSERFGLGVDADGDGIADELTVGDITAITIYQAALQVPGQVLPRQADRLAAAIRGETLFAQVGCTTCHVPQFELESRFFTEPNPFNPDGNLKVSDVSDIISFDMTRRVGIPGPRLRRGPGGTAIMRPFTDLKRHNLNDADYDHFANEMVPQGMINGFAPASNFTIAPYPRPTEQFLTRKLWDAGSSDPYGHRGDLTTMTQAIFYHGGDARTQRDAFFALSEDDQAAIIEFLKTLQIRPPNSKLIVIQ